MVTALQASGAYLNYTDQREPLLYGPEMSKRSRAIELWATMKYLGKSGIDEMITGFHLRAKQLAAGLAPVGFNILNEVVFNQVLVRCDSDEATQKVLAYAQQSGECWMGGSTWQGQAAIRISVCSWRTSAADIEQTIAVLKRGKESS
jgi:glutamate/tyrosine decarboxylase-like PLP-dependent enzyme